MQEYVGGSVLVTCHVSGHQLCLTVPPKPFEAAIQLLRLGNWNYIITKEISFGESLLIGQ